MTTMTDSHAIRVSFCLAMLIVWAASSPDAAAAKDSLKVGEEAPTFVMLDSATDDAVFLRDYTGKALRKPWQNKTRHVVLVSFWASWCEPCKEEIPILMKLAEEFKGQPLKIFLVNTGEAQSVTKDTVRAIMKRRGYTLQCLMDNTGAVAKRYLVQSLPVLVVIDKFGIIRKVNLGYHQGFEQGLRMLIPELLRESEEGVGSKSAGGGS